MSQISLKSISCRAPKELDKEETKGKTEKLLEELDELQNLLYANGSHSILVVIQGMDASGKDGAIRNVFGSLNPQGITVTSFKAPTEVELSHDFLWRIHQVTPAKGMIGVFNRSYYEDVLVTRVHKMIDSKTARKRFEAINHFEELLQVHSNTLLLKFYLHVSEEEQKERLEERIAVPRKQWKYNGKDFQEAKKWPEYRKVYEECFQKCNHPEWIIIPADQNWYKEYQIALHLHQALSHLKLKYPELDLPSGKSVTEMQS